MTSEVHGWAVEARRGLYRAAIRLSDVDGTLVARAEATDVPAPDDRKRELRRHGYRDVATDRR